NLPPGFFALSLFQFAFAFTEFVQHRIVLLDHHADLVIGVPAQRLVHARQCRLSKGLSNELERECKPLRNEVRQCQKYNKDDSKDIQDVRQHYDLCPLQIVRRLKERYPEYTDQLPGLARLQCGVRDEVAKVTNAFRLY